jgi:hypothetical protein
VHNKNNNQCLQNTYSNPVTHVKAIGREKDGEKLLEEASREGRNVEPHSIFPDDFPFPGSCFYPTLT